MEQEFSDTEIWQEEYSDGLNGVFTVPPKKNEMVQVNAPSREKKRTNLVYCKIRSLVLFLPHHQEWSQV